jgi:hypothetical protein
MNKIKIKKLAIPLIIILIIVFIIGLFLLNRYLNEPKRIVETMLNASLGFDQKPTKAKKFFESDYLGRVNVDQASTEIPIHAFKVSSSNNQDIVTLSFSESKKGAIGSTDVAKFYLKRHGLYPWFYWTKIASVELLDVRYISIFANILPEVKKTQAKFGEPFTLSGRFEVSLENFQDLSGESIGDQIKKYSFDIKYQTKPIDFHALSLAVSLLGEDDVICVKSQKAEISDLTKDIQNIQLTVFGDFCNPRSIQVDGVGIDSLNVSLK